MTRPGGMLSPHARCAPYLLSLAICSVAVQIAGAGFLFTPHEPGDDTAKCFYCGIELSGWDPDDNPVYGPFVSPIALVLTSPERNTGGGLRNAARSVPSSPQGSRNFLRRRRVSVKLHLKHPYKLRRPPELVPLRPPTQHPILMAKNTTLGRAPVPGQPRRRRPPLGLLLEVPPLGPEQHPRLSRQMNRAGAT